MLTPIARGFVYLAFAQFIFVLTGYGINLFLARRFGPELYGLYGVIMSLLVWFELSVITGVPTAVQKFAAEKLEAAHGLKRLALKLQLFNSAGIFVVVFLATPLIGMAMGDMRITNLLRLALVDLVIYGLHKFYVSFLSGVRQFGRQAILSIIYSIAKFCAVVGLVLVGFSIKGALVGNILGSVAGVVLAFPFVKGRDKSAEISSGKIMKFAVPIVFFYLTINVLLSLDIWFVKALLSDAMAGYYVAASNLAKIPYFIFIALTLVILPSISRAISEKNDALVRRYIQQSIRAFLLIVLPAIAICLPSAQAIIVFLYGQEYVASAAILNILLFAGSLLALFYILTTIINADGRPLSSFAIASSCVILAVFLNYVLIRTFGILGAAGASTVACLSGVLIAGWSIKKKFRVNLINRSVGRISLAAICVGAVSIYFPASGWTLVVKFLSLSLIYVVLLAVLREFNAAKVLDFSLEFILKKRTV